MHFRCRWGNFRQCKVEIKLTKSNYSHLVSEIVVSSGHLTNQESFEEFQGATSYV